MKLRVHVYAAVTALAAALPFDASGMGFGNTAPVVDSVSVSPAPVPANGTATISCAAHDNSAVARLTIDVGGGTLPNGTTRQDLVITVGASASGSIAWTTPAPGSYSVTCTAADAPTFGAPLIGSRAISATTVAIGPPPVIDRVTASATLAYPADSIQLSGAAHDPAGGTLFYAWSATGGTLSSSGTSATWTAPAALGDYRVTFTATNANGSASDFVVIGVRWARSSGSFAADNALAFVPVRIAVDSAGFSYVSNARARALQVFTPLGGPLLTIPTQGTVAGLALGSGGVWTSDEERRAVELLDPAGRVVRALGAGSGEFVRPVDVAVNPATGAVLVADAGAAAVRVFDAMGAPTSTIAIPGGFPAGVAVEPATGRIFVTDNASATVLVFDSTGAPVGTFGSFGAGSGQMAKPGGIAFGGDGNVYVVDAYQERVAVFSGGGAFLAFAGEGGQVPGTLSAPIGIAADASGHLLVTSSYIGRIESLALRGATAAVCPGDSDCDGMPDLWEIAHHLNPFDPRDAYVDSDNDGLLNVDEYRHGTDPWNPDTDGDGYTDGQEVASGFDPLDPNDHRPVLTASAPAESGPGLVRISSSVRSEVACTVSWRQTSGPSVALRGGTSSPSYVARAAAEYAFEGTASCGRATSQPATVRTRILDVAPRPDAGRIVVIEKGDELQLDGRFSSDANGDAPLSLAWEQSFGRPVTGRVTGSVLPLKFERPGYYAFLLSAADPAGNSAAAEAPVYVVGDDAKAPTALAVSPVASQVGRGTTLDASASVGARLEPLAFSWVQVSGPAVNLGGASSAHASFVPPAPGAYAFDVSVQQKGLASPPARVQVFVAAAGASLPAAAAAAVSGPVPVGEPVSLDGSASSAGSGGSLEYAWRQVSGPAAGLTDADRAVATVVPFGAGSYVFELTVTEGPAAGVPARVRFDADARGVVRPVAAASAPATVRADQPARLDGRGSSASGRTLHFRWTQVAGPWVALDTEDPARPRFKARLPGVYAFELEVDDGAVRSAPARVTLQVVASEEEGER